MRASRFRGIIGSLSIVAATFVSSPVEAATLVLGASTQAWYSQGGFNLAVFGNQSSPIFNTFTGVQDSVEFRSYFVFDVGSITSPIASGTLQLYQKRYYSSVSTETITLYDVTTPTTTLVSTQGTAAFDDLGSGEVYGSGTINADPPQNDLDNFVGEYFEVVLTQAAIDGINQAVAESEDFAIGIMLSSIDDTPYSFTTVQRQTEGVLFSGGSTDPLQELEFPAQLILVEADPEPPLAVTEPSAIVGFVSVLFLGALVKNGRSRR